MRNRHLSLILRLIVLLCLLGAHAARAQTAILFDADWRFHRGGAARAEDPAFDDSQWRRLDLPHDWSIEDLPGTASPFSIDATSQVNGGFTTGGTGWYRKTFTPPREQQGKRIMIQFDGVYMNAEVWMNGKSLGEHPYGYTSFWFDVTDQVKFDNANVIAVKVRNEGENSRWYSGSGIYRHVWLKVLDPVHVVPWGVYLTTPRAENEGATVTARTRVVNQSGVPARVALVTRILDPRGEQVATARREQIIAPGSTLEFNQDAAITTPSLWMPEYPDLYTAVSEVTRDGQTADRVETKFGIRSIAFDVTKGFHLNGQVYKLKGGCIHHDNGPLGAAAYDRAEERKVELLKASGYNAIRCSHNPPSPALLDACDRLGMMVIDEAFDMWDTGKNPNDYHLYFKDWWQKDVTSMVERDRNHPSVIMWSIGNEIPNRDKPEVVATAKMLGDFIRKLDPTRPITSAVNDLRPDKDPYFAMLDVAGYNYAVGGDHNQKDIFGQDHARVPGRIMMCTESYPLEAFGSWMAVLDHPYVIGDFVWTAWDYLGEASIGWRGYYQYQNFYPWNLAFCGDIDSCGWKRPQSFYRDALWKELQISIFVKLPRPSFELNPKREAWSKWHFDDLVADWTWPGEEGKPLEVTVFSSCETVELFLNGKSLGTKPTNRATQFKATWQVPYQPGELKAVGEGRVLGDFTEKTFLRHRFGMIGGVPSQKVALLTAEAPTQFQNETNRTELKNHGEVLSYVTEEMVDTHGTLRLEADRTELKNDGQDLSYVTVELVDAHGTRLPKAENLIQFKLEGPGTIVAVGNAKPVSTESFQQPQRHAWQGRALVVIKSTNTSGTIKLTAKTDGLPAANITLKTMNDPPAHFGQNYYVDALNGDDKNPGTSPDKAWKCLHQHDIDFEPGDRLLLAGGQTFEGPLQLNLNYYDSPAHPFLVGSFGEGRATIDGGDGDGIELVDSPDVKIENLNLIGSGRKNGNNGAGINLIDSRYVEVSDVECQGFRLGGVNVHGGENVRLVRVYAHDNGAAGISCGIGRYSGRARNLYIGYCTAENNPGDPKNLTNHSGNGIVVGQLDGGLIEYCEAMNNGWDMPRQGNGPVGIWGYMCDRLTIQHCISHDNKSPGSDGGGFDLDGGATNSIMQYNLSYNNMGCGYLLCQYAGASAWKNNIVRYNVSDHDGAKNYHAGIGLYLANGGISDAQVYNNVIVNPDYAIGTVGDLPGIIYRNNIFMAGRAMLEGPFSRSRFEHNLYWNTGKDAVFQRDGNQTVYATLEAWSGATGQEMVNGKSTAIVGDPKLVLPGPMQKWPTDPKTLEQIPFYRLQAGSPAIGAGMVIEPNGGRDLFGGTVPGQSRPSLGCHEAR